MLFFFGNFFGDVLNNHASGGMRRGASKFLFHFVFLGSSHRAMRELFLFRFRLAEGTQLMHQSVLHRQPFFRPFRKSRRDCVHRFRVDILGKPTALYQRRHSICFYTMRICFTIKTHRQNWFQNWQFFPPFFQRFHVIIERRQRRWRNFFYRDDRFFRPGYHHRIFFNFFFVVKNLRWFWW